MSKTHIVNPLTGMAAGEGHYSCKITDLQVAEIRKLYRPGNGKQLAAVYGVTAAYIRRIANGTERTIVTAELPVKSKSESAREYYQANAATEIAKRKAFRAANLERIKAQRHARYIANREKMIAIRTEYRNANRQEINERWRQRYHEKKEAAGNG